MEEGVTSLAHRNAFRGPCPILWRSALRRGILVPEVTTMPETTSVLDSARAEPVVRDLREAVMEYIGLHPGANAFDLSQALDIGIWEAEELADELVSANKLSSPCSAPAASGDQK